MMDKETQAALGRIQDKSWWTVGWLWCAIGSGTAVIQVVRDWNAWDSFGRIVGVCFIAMLVVFPSVVIVNSKKGKPVSVGWLLFSSYALLSISILAFSHTMHR
jgi:hypothetical protein